MKYTKHSLTLQDDSTKESWSTLRWHQLGKIKIEKVKYPHRYMDKLFESGIEEVLLTECTLYKNPES